MVSFYQMNIPSMNKRWLYGLVVIACAVLFCCGYEGVVWGKTSGQVQLKDGSRFWGEILTMEKGILKVRVDFSDGDTISIQWDKVVGVKTWEPLMLVLDNDVKLKGNVQVGDPGIMMLETDFQSTLLPIDVTKVVAINPPVKKPVRFSGNLNGGSSSYNWKYGSSTSQCDG